MNKLECAPSFLDDVQDEYQNAKQKHPDSPTMHHGLAVIQEEFEELKQEIFKKVPDEENLKSELKQLAAMCLRFHEDLLIKAWPNLNSESE